MNTTATPKIPARLPDGHIIKPEGNLFRVLPNDLPSDRLYLDTTRPLNARGDCLTIPLIQLDENNNKRRVSTPTDMSSMLYLSQRFDWDIATKARTYKATVTN